MPDTAELRRQVAVYSDRDFGWPVRPTIKRSFSSSRGGILAVSRHPVFRNGTFIDMHGWESTWEDSHINQMVDNYTLLSSRKIFAEIPVRDGHPGFLVNGLPGTGRVIGWHTSLVSELMASPIDGKEYQYLLADYDIIESDAIDSYEKGLFRNRSSEVGYFTTNDWGDYFPVYQGFAFVDIPAVQGLNFTSPLQMHGFSKVNSDKTFTVFMEGPVTSPQPPTPTLPNQPGAGGTGPSQPISFSVNGNVVTDPVAVQNHINVLERYRTESLAAGREAYVSDLAARNKIMASAIDSMSKFALSLTPEQFEDFKSTWDVAPANSLLGGQHGGATQTGQPAGVDPKDLGPGGEDLSILRQTVEMHRAAGMKEDRLHKTASYIKLMELTNNKG